MSSSTQAGYTQLAGQAAAILGLATFAGCTAVGISFTDALFRAAVVYVGVSILSFGVRGLLLKMTDDLLKPTSTGERPSGDDASIAGGGNHTPVEKTHGALD